MSALLAGGGVCLKRLADLSEGEIELWNRLTRKDAELRRSFMTNTFAREVARAGADVRVLVRSTDGAPCFLLPLQRLGGILGRFGLFEPVGGVMTDYFGAVAESGERIDISRALAETKGKVNAIVFTHLDESQSKFGLSGSEFRVGLRTRLGERPGQYWSDLRGSDKKLVYDTERRERRFQSEVGPLVFEWASGSPEADLDWLIESKKAQYERTGKMHAPLFIEANAALLRGLLSSRDDACRGELSVLRSGGKIIAAHFGLRCFDVLHVWFPVYDRKYAQYSLGRILLKNMFSAAEASGIKVFDRGEGDSQAKRDFANEEHVFSKGLWLAPNWHGYLAKAALGIAWRIEFWRGSA